ncbi:hypothetical protein SAMN05428954_0913 [Streptomyces sp. 2112.3]|nr:hypothetical protein BX261_6316 [Streptomyces sp. 2321.6]SDQ91596.1 hypothetical protein SAMN05216511_0937 [Streptomyces sp. KS_16]SED74918.1 hypothetical protein SAMN05428954_0913 [Streptomyces sp. 2112.3]SED92396.1 hypothetical protein SAMN05428940_6342 [Streptomyces sp. 2133.1]SNC73122.1 hypothetical protein SAMN06272741_6243 [Streptomyces sp. 2114.4]
MSRLAGAFEREEKVNSVDTWNSSGVVGVGGMVAPAFGTPSDAGEMYGVSCTGAERHKWDMSGNARPSG